jgi:hypothetical protein
VGYFPSRLDGVPVDLFRSATRSRDNEVPPVAICGCPLLIVFVLKQIASAIVEEYHTYLYSFLVVVFIIAGPFNREF